MPPPPTNTPEDRARWAARFGWMAGGIIGLFLGFALTYLIETKLLVGRVESAPKTAAHMSSVIVSAMFLTGALSGEAFGAHGGKTRYQLLGSAAGISLAVLAWAWLVVAR